MMKLSNEAIREHALLGGTLPTGKSTMHLYPLNGTAARVVAGDTAYRHRDSLWSQVIVGVDSDPTKADVLRNWAVGYYDELHKHSTGAAYVNFMLDEGPDRIRATTAPTTTVWPGSSNNTTRTISSVSIRTSRWPRTALQGKEQGADTSNWKG